MLINLSGARLLHFNIERRKYHRGQPGKKHVLTKQLDGVFW